MNSRKALFIAGLCAALLVLAAVLVLLRLKGGEGTSEIADTSAVILETAIQTEAAEWSVVADNSEDDISSYLSYSLDTADDCREVLSLYAADHGFDIFAYPNEVVNFLIKNHEALEFVLRYPELAGSQDDIDVVKDIDVSGDFSPLKVPYYYQYDLRWGYRSYADGLLGINGSGPTALSMVASYLTGNSDFNPAWVAMYSENNGYSMTGGTSWTLMSDGAYNLGIDVTAISADQQRIDNNLDVGNLVMCLMGPGDFTDTVQYIVIVGKTDEGYEIRDPGSPERSAAYWSFDTLASQMTGCWVMRIL